MSRGVRAANAKGFPAVPDDQKAPTRAPLPMPDVPVPVARATRSAGGAVTSSAWPRFPWPL
jgi:hypothetical protein